MAALGPIKVDDIVECDKRGRRFHALVLHKPTDTRCLTIRPLQPGISYRSVTSREVVAHWRKTKNVRQ